MLTGSRRGALEDMTGRLRRWRSRRGGAATERRRTRRVEKMIAQCCRGVLQSIVRQRPDVTSSRHHLSSAPLRQSTYRHDLSHTSRHDMTSFHCAANFGRSDGCAFRTAFVNSFSNDGSDGGIAIYDRSSRKGREGARYLFGIRERLIARCSRRSSGVHDDRVRNGMSIINAASWLSSIVCSKQR